MPESTSTSTCSETMITVRDLTVFVIVRSVFVVVTAVRDLSVFVVVTAWLPTLPIFVEASYATALPC